VTINGSAECSAEGIVSTDLANSFLLNVNPQDFRNLRKN